MDKVAPSRIFNSAALEVTSVPSILNVVAFSESELVKSVTAAVAPAPSAYNILVAPSSTATFPPEPCVKVAV